MSWTNIQNGENAVSVRNKINELGRVVDEQVTDITLAQQTITDLDIANIISEQTTTDLDLRILELEV